MDEVNMEHLEITPQSQITPDIKSQGTIAVSNQLNDDKIVNNRVTKNGTPAITAQGSADRPVCVRLKRVSANWVNGQLPPTLCNVSVTIKPGELCALVGAVGSGKSSVLHLLLKELNPGAGSIILTQNESQNNESLKMSNGYITDNPNLSISYASQEPWLFGGTVRDNILFGQPYDRTRYMQVVTTIRISCSSMGERNARFFTFNLLTRFNDRLTVLRWQTCAPW